jgi:MraZ protein
MFLTGRFVRTLDEKYRLAIPKSLRDCLENQTKDSLFVAPGLDGSLAIYPQEAFARLADRLASSSPTARDVRDYTRLFFSRAESTKIDGQGRLRIPAELVQWAKLESGIVLLGVQDRMEVWRPDAWTAYADERRERYDQIAEAAFHQPGIPTLSPSP